jgi:hypothetical protein
MLSINNLHDEILERQHRRNQIFEDVLDKVISKIKYVNSISDNCYVVYKLNNFIFGIPKFDINKCGNYLQVRLSDAGFYAKYNQQNLLFISWKSKPTTEKILETHQVYIPKLKHNNDTNLSISYYNQHLNYKSTPIAPEPNMLRLKNNNSPDKSKQIAFESIDNQFINSTQMLPRSNYNTTNVNTHNALSYNTHSNTNDLHNFNYSSKLNKPLHSTLQTDNNSYTNAHINTNTHDPNIKTFTISKPSKNYNLSFNKPLSKSNASNNNISDSSNLDEFLGTLL